MSKRGHRRGFHRSPLFAPQATVPIEKKIAEMDPNKGISIASIVLSNIKTHKV